MGMAPKKVGTPWLIRIPDELAAQIDKRAAEMNLSRAEMVRKMLNWANAQPRANADKQLKGKR